MSLCHSHTSETSPAVTSRGKSGGHASFFLGVAIAALIWAALGVGTTISLSTSVVAQAPTLTISR